MINGEPQGNLGNQTEKIKKLRGKTGSKIEVISGVPVFTVEIDRKDEAMPKIVALFGENTVFRIINSHFVGDAIEFGTDRINIDEYDFRSEIFDIIGGRYGHDIWGVENWSKEMGLRRADVFCGTSYEYFSRGKSCSSTSLGFPEDRSAVLIFDSNKLTKIEGTDGYAFKEISAKKEALLAVIKFEQHLFEFEIALAALETIDDKIELLEKEVNQNMNTLSDLKKIFNIALHILALLQDESSKNPTNPSLTSTLRITKLNEAIIRLKYEVKMIAKIHGLKEGIDMVRQWSARQQEGLLQRDIQPSFFDKLRARMMPNKPGKIIASIDEILLDPGLLPKYRDSLLEVRREAEKCKQELEI